MTLFGAKVLLILEAKNQLIEDIVNHAVSIVREKYGILVEYNATYMPYAERAILINGHKIKIKGLPSISELVDLIVILSKPIERSTSELNNVTPPFDEKDLYMISY